MTKPLSSKQVREILESSGDDHLVVQTRRGEVFEVDVRERDFSGYSDRKLNRAFAGRINCLVYLQLSEPQIQFICVGLACIGAEFEQRGIRLSAREKFTPKRGITAPVRESIIKQIVDLHKQSRSYTEIARIVGKNEYTVGK